MKLRFTKLVSQVITLLLIFTMLPLSVFTSNGVSFTSRTTAPSSNNTYYYGSNPFYNSGYGMPNCTCYAYGRAYELLGTKPKLSTGNAGAWWWYNKNYGYYSYGSTPKLGAVACWDKYDQNKGHVAVVEKISGSTVLISESHYGGTFFNTRTINANSSDYLTSMRFLGYIYIGEFEPGPHTCSFSGSYFEAAHPHKVYQQCSCGKTQYTGATKAYSSCSSCMKLSWAYAVPFKAYTINTGKTTVYNSVGGSAISNKIYDTDLCTISEVYDCGWCKVTFPLDAGGSQTGYVKVSTFVKSGGYKVTASKQLTTYSRSDLKTSIGYAASGDKIYILGNTSSAVQISYPLSAGGYKVGWIPISSISATIKYNANGGSGTMANTSAKYQSTFTLTSNKFTKTGYTFAGWNVYRSSDKKWYTDGDGWQTASSISSNGYSKKTYKNSWSGTLNKTWMNLAKTSETFTFYPIWKANTLSVSYNANGGSINSDTYKISSNLIHKVSDGSKYVQSWTYNSKKTNGLINISTLGLSKTGHTFKGWGTTSSGGTVFDQDNVNLVPTDINSNIKTGSCSTTLYAIWTPNSYKITFDANGGIGAPASQTKTYGKTLTLSSTIPERKGYNFLGWSTSPTASSAMYSAGGSFAEDNNTTLYAVWELITHNHVYKTIVTKPATCTENGLETFTCDCGDIITKTIPASGHTEIIIKGYEATCTEDGLTDSVCCSVCKEVLAKAVVLDAKGHSADKNWTTISTNVVKIEQVKYCTDCGVVVETREITQDSINPSNPTDSTEPSTGGGDNTTDPSEPSTGGEDNPTDSTEPSTGGEDNPTTPDAIGLLGDVNCDGKVNIKDATEIQKHIAGLVTLSETGLTLADVDNNSNVNIKDATAIQKHIAGIETGYPIGKTKTK